MLKNYSNLSGVDLAMLEDSVAEHRTLGNVLAWAGRVPGKFLPHIVAEVVTQDEYTHDVIVPYDGLYLVYDTT